MQRENIERNHFNQITQKLTPYYYPDLEENMNSTDESDWSDVKKGYIEGTKLSEPIYNSVNKNNIAWNIMSYDFMNNAPAPSTVHPNLWRMEQMNNVNGLFEVIKNSVYQIRSYDLSTMSIIKSSHGWIVIDPLCGSENAVKGWRIFKSKIDPSANLIAIFITHSHVDHYKGVMGLISDAGKKILTNKKQSDFANYEYDKDYVAVIAPNGFYDESISENLYLGGCMSRRAIYMYGSSLPRDQYGHIGSGLGKTVGTTTGSIPVPTIEVVPENEDLTTFKVDGLSITMQDVPGTEAPAEMHIYFSDYKMLCPGENVTHTMHNLLTPRGAKVRDPKAFGRAIDRAMKLFPDTEVIIGTHHWPIWGKERCLDVMKKERDMYYFFNDQVIRLLNKGMNMEEIASVFQLPASLRREYYNRGYYGSINHNVKAVVQRYIGWWDGNPANYFKQTDEEVAERFVEDMGGAEKVLEKARQRFEQGDYRWTISLTRHIVFDQSGKTSDQLRKQAKELEADAMEQLAYSFEAGTWRNIFLSGAFELRGYKLSQIVSKTDMINSLCANLKSLPIDYMFEYLTTLIDGFQAGNIKSSYCVIFGASPACRNYYYMIELENGVFHYKQCEKENDIDIQSTVLRFKDQAAFVEQLKDFLMGQAGDYAMADIFRYIDLNPTDWNIIEPLKK